MTETREIRVHELDTSIIPPLTERYQDPNYNGGSKLVVVGKPGCFAAGTPVLMYDGYIKNIEDVRINDTIMGPDSTPRKVLELCRDREDMFKILPEHGDPYTVNLNHDLVLKSLSGEVIEISVKDYLEKSSEFKDQYFIFRTGVTFPEPVFKPVINPYYAGKEYAKVRHSKITRDFLTGTRIDRLNFLAGYIKRSGYYSIHDKIFVIQTQSELHVQDLVFLIRSLGLHAEVKVMVSGSSQDLTFNIEIHGDSSVLDEIQISKSMQKRIVHARYATPISLGYSIEQITLRDNSGSSTHTKPSVLMSKFRVIPQGPGQYYGFRIDGDHRFLLGSFDVVRNTGKSTLIRALMYAKKHIFPVGVAMSGTEDSNHSFKEIMPSTFVFNEYNEDKLRDIIKRQKLARQHLPNPWAIVILDDVTDDPKVFHKPLQQGIYKKGRHWNFMYILSLQYGMDVKPVIRTNVDGIFILREPLLKNRRTLYENYASVVPDFDTFCQLMDELTEDYQALYIHNATNVNDWTKCVFYWKAPLIPKGWRFGCPEYWDFHNARYDPEYVDPV